MFNISSQWRIYSAFRNSSEHSPSVTRCHNNTALTPAPVFDMESSDAYDVQ
jgi:hypothetical protein